MGEALGVEVYHESAASLARSNGRNHRPLLSKARR